MDKADKQFEIWWDKNYHLCNGDGIYATLGRQKEVARIAWSAGRYKDGEPCSQRGGLGETYDDTPSRQAV
jgi:hypothetical protein